MSKIICGHHQQTFDLRGQVTVALMQFRNRCNDVADPTGQLLFDSPEDSFVSPVVRRRRSPCNEVETSVATHLVGSDNRERTNLAGRRDMGPATRICVQVTDTNKAKRPTRKFRYLADVIGGDVRRLHEQRVDGQTLPDGSLHGILDLCQDFTG